MRVCSSCFPVFHGYSLGVGCDVSLRHVGLEFLHVSNSQIVESNVKHTSNAEQNDESFENPQDRQGILGQESGFDDIVKKEQRPMVRPSSAWSVLQGTESH